LQGNDLACAAAFFWRGSVTDLVRVYFKISVTLPDDLREKIDRTDSNSPAFWNGLHGNIWRSWREFREKEKIGRS
jgi:hypothetical protein